MHRRIVGALTALIFVVAACGGPAVIEDPNEILHRGFDSMLELDSFTINAELSGTVSIEPGSPGFSLTGTSATGAVDLANERVAMSFVVPPLFGLTGELRLVEGFTYVRTSLTGPLWSRSEVSELDAEELEDPSIAIEELRSFLSDEQVDVRKLDDAECGEDTCYHIQVALPSELLEDAADDLGGGPGEVLGDAVIVDLLFDKERGYLRSASTTIESPESGTLTLTITFDGFNEPVEVEAPPEDEIDESGGDFLPLP